MSLAEGRAEKNRSLLVLAGKSVGAMLADLPVLHSWTLLLAATADELLELAASHPVDAALIVCDSNATPGLETLARLRRQQHFLPIIIAGAELPEVMADPRLTILSDPLDPATLAATLEQVSRGQTPYQKLVEGEDQARRHLEDLLLIRQAAEAIHSSPDLNSYLELLVERIMAAVGVRHCSLMLCEQDSRLRIAAARGLAPEVIASTRVAAGEGIAGQVLASGEPLLIADLDADRRFDRSRGFDHYLTNSLLSVPLSFRGRTYGVLNVNNKKDGTPFSSTDLHLLSGVAHQAMLAMENFRLVADLQASRRELERSNERLQQQLDNRSRLVCNLSHELKTPLTSVLGYVELSLNHFEQLEAAELQAYLTRVQDEGLQMNRLINGMLTLFSLESGADSWCWQTVELAACLHEELDRRGDDIRRLDLQLECIIESELPALHTDIQRLEQLLAALLDNAIKFSCPGGLLRVELRAGDAPQALLLSLVNEGPSIPAEAAETIFDQYTQLGDPRSAKPSGVGVGLAICRTIVERLAGCISLEPYEGKGTRVLVSLPNHKPEDYDDQTTASPDAGL